ncbi:hypothetical protein DL766_004924 [Monosporascus sp. MC13-8B]|uniref:BTB domain-containing protein n=1 Tax=Monosporascus cannonballus TaxID=155416 RepID=A0ABY0HGW7_9PEZI|nr:hypothetical protein DL763_010206 [Monosporascus cannonballus]RYO92794.1 hypothetical protein DL762_001500 [Monosporascus cannonballus]RYP30323.1 hypothetical protein DL766_004924 [Monosporascus sp. MC13-8B]
MAKKKKTGKQQPVFELAPPLGESCMEPTPNPQPTAQRPKTSSDDPSLFSFDLYWIAASQNPWGQCIIHLPDVDESTGHVVVHYLYTGAYQTLDDTETSPVEEVNIEFKRAVLAYIAAKTYGLQGLQQLAKHKMEHFGTEMDIFDVVEAIKEHFSKLPDDTAWFHDYLEGKAKSAFEEDHTVFARDNFFDRVNDVALARILEKCVVELYNNKVSRRLDTAREPTPDISEECIPDGQDPPIEEAPAEEPSAIEETFAGESPGQECLVQDCPIEDLAPEDALVQDASTKRPVDYDFDEFNAAPTEPAQVAEEYPPEADIWGFSSGSKAKRNKKGAVVTVEEAVPEPAPEPEEAKEEEDPWYSFRHTKVMKKMKEAATLIEETSVEPELEAAKEEPKIEEPPPSPETELELAPDREMKNKIWSFWEVKKQISFVNAAVPDQPKGDLIVEPPPPEPIKEEKKDDQWPNWAPTATKKKGKKGAVVGAPPPTPLPVPEPESELTDPRDPEPELAAVNAFEAALAGEEKIIQAENEDMRESNGYYSDLKAESGQPVEAEGEVCTVRAKHLLEGDKWKNRKQCRAILRQVAIQLARAGHADEDGYEMVDRALMK